jgi:hypothetical protein
VARILASYIPAMQHGGVVAGDDVFITIDVEEAPARG